MPPELAQRERAEAYANFLAELEQVRAIFPWEDRREALRRAEIRYGEVLDRLGRTT